MIVPLTSFTLSSSPPIARSGAGLFTGAQRHNNHVRTVSASYLPLSRDMRLQQVQVKKGLNTCKRSVNKEIQLIYSKRGSCLIHLMFVMCVQCLY